MGNKEGKEESRKRGTTEPEKRTRGLPIKWKRKNLGNKLKTKNEQSELFLIFPRFFLFHFIGHPFVLFSGLTFPLFHGSSFPSLFFIPFFPLFHDPSFPSLLLSLSSLSSMVLPFPLYSSSLSSVISSPCRPGLAPGT